MSTFQQSRYLPAGAEFPDRIVANALESMRRRNELIVLGLLSFFYVLIYSLQIAEVYRVANWVGPVVLATTLGTSCYRIVSSNPVAIWAPLFWFRLACAVYFGIGAIVPYIADAETLDNIHSLFFFDDTDLLKVNTVTTTSIAITLSCSYALLRKRTVKIDAATSRNSRSGVRGTTFVFAVGFLLVGGVIRYGVTLPYALGQSETTVAGMYLSLGKAYYVGIYLLIVYALNYNRRIITLIVVLVFAEIVASVATFAKTELLLVLIFVLLGFLSRGATFARVALGATLVLSAYFLFQPLVGYGRAEVNTSYGGRATLEQRWAIIGAYLEDGALVAPTDTQEGLARLSYVNANAFVINQYDSGFPGSTLADAAAVIVPRSLWPDKPIITQLGSNLYYLVRGRGGSALGIGHFAEAYWNFGWVGIPPFMAMLGLILSVFTRVSIRVVARQDWLLLPVVFLGVNMGVRVDGHFVPDILGAGWTALVLGLALVIARSMVRTFALRSNPVTR